MAGPKVTTDKLQYAGGVETIVVTVVRDILPQTTQVTVTEANGETGTSAPFQVVEQIKSISDGTGRNYGNPVSDDGTTAVYHAPA